MRSSKSRFKHESLQDADTIRDLLRALTKGISKGKLVFSDEDDEIVMEPQGLLNLKLTASKGDNRNRLSLRISWQTEEDIKNVRKPVSIK